MILFDEFEALGVDGTETPNVTVQNSVRSADLDTHLNLNAIAIGLGLEHVEYAPAQFHDLVYRLEEPSVVCLLFGRGRLVIRGTNRGSDVEGALVAVHSRLDQLGLFD